MKKDVNHNIKLGIFVVSGVLLLVIGLYFIGNNKNMFGKTITLYATFQNVSGLQAGNNVRYSGIDIGTVKQILIVSDTTVKVEMSIEANLKEIIRKNARASVGTDGLMGNKLVNIHPGTVSFPLISDGDEILSIQNLDADEMLRTLEYTNSNVAVISENLKNITGNINNSKGTIYTLLMDTTLMEGIGHTIRNLDVMSSNLSMTSAELSDVVHQIKEGKGLVGVLLNDSIMGTDLQKTISEVKASGELINFSANELKTIVQKINNGNGSIGTLLNDTGTAGRLKSSLINIENSTKNFNENMEALKKSFLLRGYFKRQEKLKQNEKKGK